MATINAGEWPLNLVHDSKAWTWPLTITPIEPKDENQSDHYPAPIGAAKPLTFLEEPAWSHEWQACQDKLKLGERYARLKEVARRVVKEYIRDYNSDNAITAIQDLIEEL